MSGFRIATTILTGGFISSVMGIPQGRSPRTSPAAQQRGLPLVIGQPCHGPGIVVPHADLAHIERGHQDGDAQRQEHGASSHQEGCVLRALITGLYPRSFWYANLQVQGGFCLLDNQWRRSAPTAQVLVSGERLPLGQRSHLFPNPYCFRLRRLGDVSVLDAVSAVPSGTTEAPLSAERAGMAFAAALPSAHGLTRAWGNEGRSKRG